MIFAGIAFVTFISLLVAAMFGAPPLHSTLNAAGLMVLVCAPAVGLSRVSRVPAMSQWLIFVLCALFCAAINVRLDWLPIVSLLAALALVYPSAWMLAKLQRRFGAGILSLISGLLLLLAWLAAALIWSPGNVWVRNVPVMESFGLEFRQEAAFLPLIWLCALLVSWLMSNVFESSVGRSLVVSDIDDELARSFGVERNRHLRAYHAFAAVGAVVAGWLFAQWAREVGPGVLSPVPIFAFVVCAVAGMLLGPWGCMVAAVALAFALGPAMVGRGAGWETDGKSFLALILAIATIIAVWRGFDGLNAFARRVRRKLDPHLVDMATVDERSGMKGQGAPPPGTELLRLDRVAITQPTGPALRELSFSVHAGETLGILADDPLRRRAILSLLGGQLQPDSGEVIVWSEAGRTIAQHDWVRHGIARTFSPPRLIEDFPVVDNVTVGASARLDAGVAPALVRLNQLADRTLRSEAVFHLSRIWMREYAQEMPADLSRGRRYLVELARALTADPALLVLDHPSENLESDAERDTAVGLVSDLIDSGLAVVVVDRDVTLLREMVGQLLVVDGDGEVARGATERVLAQPGVRMTLEAFK